MQNSLNEQMNTLFKPSNVQTDEIKQKDDFKEIGTGVLTGTIAAPSDIVTVQKWLTLLADYTNNPLAMLLKDNLQTFEKQYGEEHLIKGLKK